MKSTLLPDDVTILLKDVSGEIKAETMEEREKNISLGKRAYDAIPLELIPTENEIEFYEKALAISAKDTALAIKTVAEMIYDKKGKDVVLVSLIRGGIPAGVLIKRYLEKKYKLKISHYALTLIGTKGIDNEALDYILKKHDGSKLQFIDGWTGKGAVGRTLSMALSKYSNVDSQLAVLSDPANIQEMCGTHEDILIASACLNSMLSGLLSRAIPLKDSFFGAIFFEELISYDRTYQFINYIEEKIECIDEYNKNNEISNCVGIDEVNSIAKDFNVSDIHFIKPGMGETMRAFIRKKPDIILVKKESNKYTDFITEVARKNNVLVKEYPLKLYNACGIYMDRNSDIL